MSTWDEKLQGKTPKARQPKTARVVNLKFWSDDRIATLKRLWDAGESASQIALEIGATSRNAVIGKIHRLGLQRSEEAQRATVKAAMDRRYGTGPRVRPIRAPRAPAPPKPPKRVPAPILGIARNGSVFEKTRVEKSLPPIPANIWQPLAGVTPVSILDLKATHCRWPLELQGEEYPHFCGAMAIGGAWCPSHARKARPSASTVAWVEKRVAHAVKKATAA